MEINRLEISSDCRDSRGRSALIEEDVDIREIPIFQFGVFFEGFLEINNNPPFQVSGRVHSNDTILLWNDQELYFDDWVTSSRAILGHTAGGGSNRVHFGKMDGSGPASTGVAWLRPHREAFPSLAETPGQPCAHRMEKSGFE